MFHNLTHAVKTLRVMNAVAAGFGDEQNSSAIDLHPQAAAGSAAAGVQASSVRFIASLGAIAATGIGTLRVQTSPDNGVWSDVTGATTGGCADTDDNKLLIVDVYRPKARYVRCVLKRETANVTIDGIIADVYHLSAIAQAKDTTVALVRVQTG